MYDKCQFAYRKGPSTVCALLTLHDLVVKLLDNNDNAAVRLITFDMSHAFESVSHDILVNFFVHSDLPGTSVFACFLKSYLSGRCQRVRIGSTTSSISTVTNGVPQGSVLGPYLFAVFMSSFCVKNARTSVVKYADDVTIVIPVKKSDFHDVSFAIDEINNFKKWCTEPRHVYQY